MTKESIIELQKIDCNCNDCWFMQRDFDKFNEALERLQMWQFTAFESKKAHLLSKAEEWAAKEEFNIAKELLNEANRMKFIFDKSAQLINYGQCKKFNKPVTFIPNTCQIETQSCFEHRKV